MLLHISSVASDQLAERLRSVAAPIFAASWSVGAQSASLTVHVSAVSKRNSVRSSIVSALADCGLGRTKVRFHTASRLLAPRSLERLVKRLAGDEIVYDPTGSISRAKALVTAGRAARASLGSRLDGLFYAPRMRTLFVALNAKQIATGEKFKVGELADIERQVVSALGGAFASQLSDCPAIRVGFGVPSIELVPVDQRSVAGWPTRAARTVRRFWKPIAIAALFGFGANVAAAEGPAVSQTNLKVTGSTGSADGESVWFLNAGLTAPLGESWGLQVEGAAGNADDSALYGMAGHLFTRDPDSYLLGLFAAYASEDQFDLEATRLGAEAELYLAQVSILAKAGYQFSDSIGDGSFGEIELRWYTSDKFALSGGLTFDEVSTLSRIGAEWQPGFSALPGLAFRVDGVFGEDDYDSIMGGLTYYFGTNASLKDRHRRQDPDSALFSLFQSVQEQKSNLCAQYGC